MWNVQRKTNTATPLTTSTLVDHLPIPNYFPHLLHNIPLPTGRPPNSQIRPPLHRRLPIPRVPIHHYAPRLNKNTPPSTYIPSPAPTLPENILLPCCHKYKIQRRRTPRADAVHHRPAVILACCEFGEHLRLHCEVVPRAVRTPLC